MSLARKSKRPAPDAYDHLWTLLPVFVAFLAAVVFAALADERPIPHGNVAEPLSTVTAVQSAHRAADPSVPPAAAAMARVADAVAEPVAAY